MPHLPPNLYAQWRAEHLALPVLRETEAPPPPTERLLQRIWLHQRIRREALQTLDGRPVVILHPGFLNREAGPDFRNAVVQVGAEAPRSGDVEIDLQTQGWRQHQHDRNPAYGNVRLHVVWETAVTADGPLPTLALAGLLDAPLPELMHWLGGDTEPAPPSSQRGLCVAPLGQLSSAQLEELFHQAAMVRLERKALELEARARRVGWTQALWEGLFGALGYKHNLWPMRRLAELLPHLSGPGRGRPALLALQARLLGLAGLLPTDLDRPGIALDPYARRLWDVWWRDRESLADGVLPRAAWCFHGLRPANHPQRRLALAAHWVAAPAWVSRLEAWAADGSSPGAMHQTLLEFLQGPGDDFWSWHWTLQSVRMAEPQMLLGPSRTTDLAVNVILPWLWMRAVAGKNDALREEVELRYFYWPEADDNALLKLARQRLFGGPRPNRLPRTAAQQQALIQVLRDFCDHSNALCEGCRFPGLVASLRVGAGTSPARSGP